MTHLNQADTQDETRDDKLEPADAKDTGTPNSADDKVRVPDGQSVSGGGRSNDNADTTGKPKDTDLLPEPNESDESSGSTADQGGR